MAVDKRIDYEMQGGVRNYRPSEMVTAPRIAKSSPNTPTAKLAYITPEEEKILVDLNLYGSLKGKPNRGPSGLPSLEGDFGSGFGGFRGGGDYSSAETGNFSGFDGTPSGPALPPGVKPKPSQEALDLRSAAIAAGAGQRVNPGFFDSRNVISPLELARARAYANRPGNLFAKGAMRNTRGGGIMGFLTSGGIFGNLLRGLGQAFGLGKKYNEPTYDMSALSGLPYGGSAAFENLDIRDKFNRTITDDEENEDTEIMEKYNNYLLDAPPNPLTFNQFKNALDSIKEGTLPNTSTSMLPPVKLVATKQDENEELLRKLLNTEDTNLDKFIEDKKLKEDRQQELLNEILTG